MMQIWEQIRNLMKGCFSRFWDKQSLTFLFFLGISASFWLFQALNETSEREFSIPIKLDRVPKNAVITTELPKHANITLRDKGFVLLNYKYGGKPRAIHVNFEEWANNKGHVRILLSDLMKRYAEKLPSSTEIVAARPDTLEFYYNYGLHKRVPVRLQGEFSTSSLYHLTHCTLEHDSVTVYAAQQLLDTITAAYIQPTRHTDLTDTTVYEGIITPIRGAKFEPSNVRISLHVDRLVEKTVQVPVTLFNFPPGKTLRTFPSKVDVTFQVGMGTYRLINSDSFVIVADYNKLIKSKSPTYHLELQRSPGAALHIKVNPSDVEYVIEDVSAATTATTD